MEVGFEAEGLLEEFVLEVLGGEVGGGGGGVLEAGFVGLGDGGAGGFEVGFELGFLGLEFGFETADEFARGGVEFELGGFEFGVGGFVLGGFEVEDAGADGLEGGFGFGDCGGVFLGGLVGVYYCDYVVEDFD